MKTVGYLRVSTKEQAKNTKFGIPNQRDIIEKYAKNQNLSVSEWYEDDGYSGGNQLRPRLQDLLEDVKGEPTTVIVAYFDRWARDSFLHLYLEKELIKHESQLVSAAEESLNEKNPHTELMKNMTIAFAQFERQRITARMAGGRRQKAKSGGIATGRIAIGYTKDENGNIVPDKDEVSVIKRIFELRGEGLSLRHIAKYVTLSYPDTKKWSASSVRYVLNNEKYKGILNQSVQGETIRSENESLKIV